MNKVGKELRKSTHTAIVAAFGFLMALVWRDLIVEYTDKILTISPVQGKLITALMVTHDHKLAQSWTDHILELCDGEMVKFQATEMVK